MDQDAPTAYYPQLSHDPLLDPAPEPGTERTARPGRQRGRTRRDPRIARQDPGLSRQEALARARARQQRHRLIVLCALVVAAVLALVDLTHGGPLTPGRSQHRGTAATADPTGGATDPTGADPSGAPASGSVKVPTSGPGTFTFVGGTGPVIGGTGTLRKFRVAVENSVGQDPAAFDSVLEKTLADPRSWTAGRDVRFQRVAQTASGVNFTLYLASPATADKMCAQGGLHTDQYLSCSLPGQVIINLARWLTAIPGYGTTLGRYQQYALNHEIGRQLGHGNEACPGPGSLAPVMMQQSLGLRGCAPNAWPYVDGERYAGAPLP